MPFDFTHLARAVREARAELELSQAELAQRAGVSERTIKNLEQGSYTRWPHTIDAVEVALGKPEGWARTIARGELTERRQTPGDTQVAATDTPANASASAARNLPVPVQLALEHGELLDYDVVTFDVDGEPVTMVALVHTGAADDEHKREILRKQLETFGRIKGHIRAEAEAARETQPDE
jgi:transcriptional regulator with XRE-family HTH domain